MYIRISGINFKADYNVFWSHASIDFEENGYDFSARYAGIISGDILNNFYYYFQ